MSKSLCIKDMDHELGYKALTHYNFAINKIVLTLLFFIKNSSPQRIYGFRYSMYQCRCPKRVTLQSLPCSFFFFPLFVASSTAYLCYVGLEVQSKWVQVKVITTLSSSPFLIVILLPTPFVALDSCPKHQIIRGPPFTNHHS